MSELFVLVNIKTREKLLCSWGENVPPLFNQTVHYIGVTNGLGSYRQMISNGFYDRRDFKKPTPVKNNSKVERMKCLLKCKKV